MSALEPFFNLINVKELDFSKEEMILLEADLLVRVCTELKGVFSQRYKDYFRFMKFTLDMENHMLETQLVRLIIEDILSTGEYTPQGIALYTDTHEDVVNELASGINTKPLATVLRKLIELHRGVRRELYDAIGKKIALDYLSVA